MVVAAIAGLAALVMAACGDGTRPADARWAAMMVPHHEAGVALDDAALRRTGDVRVRHLAFEMNGYQGRELDELRRLAAGPARHDHPEPAGMPSVDELAGLDRLTGTAFDRRFLELMIRHHEGAVAMALDAGRDGTSDGVRAMAEAVVTVQRDQLGRMRALLSELPPP